MASILSPSSSHGLSFLTWAPRRLHRVIYWPVGFFYSFIYLFVFFSFFPRVCTSQQRRWMWDPVVRWCGTGFLPSFTGCPLPSKLRWQTDREAMGNGRSQSAAAKRANRINSEESLLASPFGRKIQEVEKEYKEEEEEEEEEEEPAAKAAAEGRKLPSVKWLVYFARKRVRWGDLQPTRWQS